MLHLSLITLALFSGVLVEPFRVAEAEPGPGHHQVCLRAAMAADGDFAVAWLDSTEVEEFYLYEFELFIRFFDKDGNPKTEPYRIEKLEDTTCIYWPCLDMDTAGNAILLWIDNKMYLRFQHFTPEGSPVDSAQTLRLVGLSGYRPCGLSLNNNGEFAAVWSGDIYVKVQRFDMEGNPKDSAFWAHDSSESWPPYFCVPGVALNDAGDLVVTWLDFTETMKNYPRFQMFDAQDESILPWEPMGHRLDDGGTGRNASRSEPFWLDDDRFVVFWTDYYGLYPDLLGRVFSNRGLTSHPVTFLMEDSLGGYGVIFGSFSAAVSFDERFAYTHTRRYCDYPDTADPWKVRCWEHGASILGEVVNNEPWRRTTLFEYTPPWGADTIDNWLHPQAPAVAACDDRIVWVYSRLNTDTIFEAYLLITDWDMGVGVAEPVTPPVTPASIIKLETTLNRLSYDLSGSVTGEARLILYSADGRRILEETIQGKGTWVAPIGFPSGVYFARVEGESATANRKLVVLK